MAHLGLDVGSVYLAAVLMDDDGAILESTYLPHKGNLNEVVEEVVSSFGDSNVTSIAKTGSSALRFEGLGEYLDPLIATLEGARHFHANIRNIIYIGAGSFHLIRLDEHGNYLRHSSNTACASGTGSFLDQQAVRLGFDPIELGEKAACAESCPSVATRCAVFAKSDMIHLQQEGVSPVDIARGLCDSLGKSVVESLLGGRGITGTTVVVGGVANNRAVLAAIREEVDDVVEVDHPELVAAIGVALHARNTARNDIGEGFSGAASGRSDILKRPPLELKLSNYPEFKSFKYYIDDFETEVALVTEPVRGETYPVYMGLDVGSTSTKATLVGPDREVIAHAYRATAGDPIKATQHIFRAFKELEANEGISFQVKAAATTGSGRKLIRKVINADLEKDEITAHARAAVHIDPAVDTILEIGGQDSKFTQLKDGMVYNSVMNYVCAAGTGSFIEEQAKKLGIDVSDYADFVEKATAPRTSDRCTVFMQRDLDILLSSGWSKKEAAAAVLYSVRDNYLNKVVSGLSIGDHVYFQGATARNRALIAAFEEELDRPISVSPYCHLTGALGLSLMLIDSEMETTTFVGFDFCDEKVETTAEECKLCNNRCNLTVFRHGSTEAAFGMKCGREYSEQKTRIVKNKNYKLFRFRERLMRESGGPPPEKPKYTIGYPMSLSFYQYLPLWKRFFHELKCKLVSSGPTDAETLKAGQKLMTAEYCAPIIVGHGHAKKLLEKDIDFVFVPHMIQATPVQGFTNYYFCPFVQTHPSQLEWSLGLTDALTDKLLAPVVRLDMDRVYAAKKIYAALGERLGVHLDEITRALDAGLRELAEFCETMLVAGDAELAALKEKKEIGLVAVGRPYNTLDSGVNLGLPEKITKMGYMVFPLDSLRLDYSKILPKWHNMYWSYGREILAAAELIKDTENLFGVFFSNFACGPDSYLISFFKESMAQRAKPYLILQLDQHGADAGYMTRIEAAIESFQRWQDKGVRLFPPTRPPVTASRKVFLSPMEEYGARLMCSALRGIGWDAEVMDENEETFSEGVKYTQGGECSPCPSTLGCMIHAVKSRGLDPSECTFFMPGTVGPCRLGQYAALDEIVFRRLGLDDIAIMEPNCDNSYQGLTQKIRKRLWDAILISDILKKFALKTRPYERNAGDVDTAIESYLEKFGREFEKGRNTSHEDVLREAAGKLITIPTTNGEKPRVGIVGEIYVRNSRFLNQDLSRRIEELGGEAMISSLAEWFAYTTWLENYMPTRGRFGALARLGSRLKNAFIVSREHHLAGIAGSLITGREDPPIEQVLRAGAKYLPTEFFGEAILTLGRAVLFIENEKAHAIVNASPTFCMPGTITTSIFPALEEEYGVPIVCNFYDGSGDPNRSLIPHLHYLKKLVSG